MPQEAAVDRSTNVEFVTEIMEFSRHGALAQVFVIEALRRYALEIMTSRARILDVPGIPRDAWLAVGEEIDAKLLAKYGVYRSIKT